MAIKSANWRAKNPERHKEHSTKTTQKNYETILARNRDAYRSRLQSDPEYNRKQYLKNAEENRERRRVYVQNNPEKVYETNRNWQRNNKGKVNAAVMLRNIVKYQSASLLSATEKAEIKKFYENCPEGYVVDHIVPLRGEKVCGLHTIKNLQYLTARENTLKSNHFLTDWDLEEDL